MNLCIQFVHNEFNSYKAAIKKIIKALKVRNIFFFSKRKKEKLDISKNPMLMIFECYLIQGNIIAIQNWKYLKYVIRMKCASVNGEAFVGFPSQHFIY